MDSKCIVCKSEKVEYVENYETFNPETEEQELVDGVLCSDCGCFHEKNNKFFEFTPIGPNLTKNCFK